MSDAGPIDPVLLEKLGCELRSTAIGIVFLVGGDSVKEVPA
jgi:hypothetical protein